MTRDELCGHVADVLATPLSDSQTIQTLLSRANGASLEDMLVAALAVAREQLCQKIFELECALDTSKSAGSSSTTFRNSGIASRV